MADQKKFLDYEGVKHLWSKVNMQDYPNNETLMAVINAIDETKADRSELIQSDWNQNNETALDFVKNRTHYEEDGKVETLSLTFPSETVTSDNHIRYTSTIDELGTFRDLVNNNTEVDVSIDDVLFTLKTQFYQGYYRLRNDTNNKVIFEQYAGGNSRNIVFYYEYLGLSNAPINVKISFYTDGTIVHKLDPKYLPDSIVSASENAVQFVEQSLTDEQKQQAQDNIGINIATDDEILEMLAQEDMLPVVVDSDGSLLADENSNILLW